MATTDTKQGFRLPWSSDRSEPTTSASTDAADPEATLSPDPLQETETPEMLDAASAAPDHVAAVEGAAEAPVSTAASPQVAATPPPAPAPVRKPNKFMADLTKAMQAAAEAAREDTLAKLGAEAKTYIESIHAESATEATDLRKQADDDVAGIREWSKAEIARIREETDDRIARRKRTLESEIEEHAAAIEARIERVQARVTAFESEMTAFFERLLAEEDPTRFAAMAESLPEPPPFDGPMPARAEWASAPVESVAVETAEPIAAAVAPVSEAAEAVATGAESEPYTQTIDGGAGVDPAVHATEWGAPSTEAPVDAAAPDPAWDTPDPAWGTPEPAAESTTDTTTVDTGDLFGAALDVETTPDDPRVAALGLTPDFAAAEAEAAYDATADDGSEDEVAPIPDDAIAARLAGLVPEDASNDTNVTTRVVVNGLISVASIAGFKRHLSRAVGVQSVGVSSGPDGEFVFAVTHTGDAVLSEIIPTLPGFGARITAAADGELTVAAHDPEAEG